jgi:hypothetical protein
MNASANPEDTQTQQMPLFYTAPTPLDSKRHATFGLKKGFGYEFSQHVNAVPVNLIEMPQVAQFYPIAFAPDATATPVAILGLRDNENLFVNKDGSWQENTYIPAYIRRYPFIFSEIPGKDAQLSLCVDMNSEIISEKEEQKFFDATGQATELSKNALEFCKSYHAAAQQTLKFGEILDQSGILVTRAAQIKTSDNHTINFTGFRIIDEEKLNALSDADFLKLRANGVLGFIYAHLFSGAQWQRLSHILNTRLKSK